MLHVYYRDTEMIFNHADMAQLTHKSESEFGHNDDIYVQLETPYTYHLYGPKVTPTE